ncbi:MAG: GNAT family N-acetyltransferase [Comamonas sp.]
MPDSHTNATFAPPVTLQGWGIRLEPLTLAHTSGLQAAAADGALWNLRITWVPAPDETAVYIHKALDMQAQGTRCPFAVVHADSGQVLGTTSYHDIVPGAQRVEIGYTWYATSTQRSHANTAAKLLLMAHAFETLGCAVIGWRTDILNTRSQRAIERLGAHKDGVIRHHTQRWDGSVRDTVMYSMLAAEWPAAQHRLLEKLKHLAPVIA